MARYTLFLARAPQVGEGQTATLGIDSDVTQISWSTDIQGGYNGCTVGLRDEAAPQFGYLPHPVTVSALGHMEIRDNGASRVVWAGRITGLKRVGGEVRGIIGTGYGVSALLDGYYTSTDTTTNITSGALLKAVLQSAAPVIKPSAAPAFWTDPGVNMHPADVSQTQVSQIVDQISKAGSSTPAAIFDFLVYENQVATFLPRIQPTSPQYLIDHDTEITQWDEDYSNAVSNVIARYTPSGGSATLTAPSTVGATAFVTRYGFSRTALVDVGTCTAAQATAWRDAYASLHTVPEIAVEVRRVYPRGMETPGGGSWPASQVRAGQWVQVGDPAATGNPGPMLIIQTTYDANSHTLKAKLGFQPRDLWGMYRRVLQGIGYFARQANYNSGFRAGSG